MSKNISRSFLAGAALALCLQQTAAVGSEFIEDMPQLTPDPERVGATIWEKPGVNRADYTRVMIEPITLFISPDSKYKGLSADELKTLSDGFIEAITKTMEPDVPVVNKAGPGVLYMRVALTNVKVAKKKRGVLGYTPIGFVATSVAHAGIGGISLKDAVLEIEALDSVSGERLFVLVDQAPKAAGAEELTWESVNKTFEWYAQRFKARMQAAK